MVILTLNTPGFAGRITAFFPSICVDSCLRRQTAFFPVYALTPYVEKAHACGAKQHFSQYMRWEKCFFLMRSGIPDPGIPLVLMGRTSGRTIKDRGRSGYTSVKHARLRRAYMEKQTEKREKKEEKGSCLRRQHFFPVYALTHACGAKQHFSQCMHK